MKINSKGTPKTLREAIQNAISDFHDPCATPNSVEYDLDKLIELHVIDFLAQKVSVLLVQAPDTKTGDQIQEFWSKVKAQPVSGQPGRLRIQTKVRCPNCNFLASSHGSMIIHFSNFHPTSSKCPSPDLWLVEKVS